MEDNMEEDCGEGTQASSTLIEDTMPEPPVPTPGRGRRRTTSARGRHTIAKPRGGRSKSAASSTRAGGSTPGRFETSAAPFTVDASPRGGPQRPRQARNGRTDGAQRDHYGQRVGDRHAGRAVHLGHPARPVDDHLRHGPYLRALGKRPVQQLLGG
ncbi:uncharacterized protein LOC142777355 [Rhipicephalus microplus]|uniref:uncharacterized protein LOC142777355 n=1 Tax=Rhipicephalus microplus TaxID=6941 RepID=UPI003F6D9D0A